MIRRRSRVAARAALDHLEAVARAARVAPDNARPVARGTLPGNAIPSDLSLRLPLGFVIVERAVTGTDRHGAGRSAAQQAIALLAPDAALAYDGTRPVVVGGAIAVSITHSLTRAFAVAARVGRIGIDIVDDVDDARFERMAPRYLHREIAFAHTPRQIASCFAAKEAGLKALGLGLLDGGMFDTCAVDVLSLDPPRIATSSHELSLVFGRTATSTIAIAYG